MKPEPLPPGAPADPDTSIDVITGNLLRLGVLASAMVLLIGGSVYLSRHATKTLAEETPDLKHFEPELEKRPAKYRRPADVFRAAGQGEGRSIIQIGVMLLVATPLLRVVFTAGAFAWRRDWVYVVIPVVVMTVLVVGILTGQVE